MKNPARFILEYCQLKHFHVTTNYYRNCRKCLNQKLWPQSDSFSYRATLKSLKTLHYSIIVLLWENCSKKYLKYFSKSGSLFFNFYILFECRETVIAIFGTASHMASIHTLTWNLSSFFVSALYSTECYTNCVVTSTKCYTNCVATKKYSTAHSQ